MVRPNFLGIGAIKAGTTWVADRLAAHPDLFMAHGKELHYFSRFFERGPDWYQGHFLGGRGCCAVGEYSVTYMDGSEETAERIHAFNPDFRLIVSVRDPVERAFSQYRWERQMGADLPSFREALKRRPDLISNSCYAANLEPFWARFPAQQLHYVRQVDIRERPDAVIAGLYAFLGLEPMPAPAANQAIVGETIQPRSRALESLRIRTHRAAMRIGAGALITGYRRLGLSKLYRKINNDATVVERLSEADRLALAPVFEADLARFKARAGLAVTG